MNRSRDNGGAEGRIRAVDPFRDLDAVVDLIGKAFGERLDPTGRATLERMRRFADSGPVLQWVWALLGRATMAPGLVWEVDGRVVGNVSVRRARSAGGYLIGNVVVHPDYRGQGIASALMRRAIKAISGRGADWVGLEVRADNEIARRLYERLRFQEVGRTHHFLYSVDSGRPVGHEPPNPVRRARKGDTDALVELMQAAIPREQRPVLEIRTADYRPGWERRVERWLRCEDEVWWVVESRGDVQGAVRTTHKRGDFPHQMEILVRPAAEAPFGGALVRTGVTRLGGSAMKPIELSLPNATNFMAAAAAAAGFRESRLLIQMKRSLRHRITVSA